MMHNDVIGKRVYGRSTMKLLRGGSSTSLAGDSKRRTARHSKLLGKTLQDDCLM